MLKYSRENREDVFDPHPETMQVIGKRVSLRPKKDAFYFIVMAIPDYYIETLDWKNFCNSGIKTRASGKANTKATAHP